MYLLIAAYLAGALVALGRLLDATEGTSHSLLTGFRGGLVLGLLGSLLLVVSTVRRDRRRRVERAGGRLDDE